MATLPIESRAFERSLGREAQELGKGPELGETKPGRTFYDRLCKVSIQNDYYNQSADRCPDFSVLPTPATAALMASLGLLYRDEGTGFSVLYNRGQKRQLANYLRRQQESNPRSWTRLTFALAATNPYFVSLTNLPIDTHPARENLYLSNRHVSGTDDEAVFLPTGCLGQWDLRPVIPPQLEVPVSKEVWQVRVLDVAGQEVICKPRCVTPKAAREKRPEELTCKDTGDSNCTNILFLDFSKLPEDLYTVQKVNSSGKVLCSREVIYTVASPVPLCLLDLLFSEPPKSPGGIYPIRHLAPVGPVEFVPVHYVLRFERRSVQWRYYIVPPRPDFRDLRIESPLPVVDFEDPRRVVLANGQTAFLFVSTRKLPLMAQTPFHFRLRGRHDLSSREQVLVDRLPAASSQRVVPSDRRGEPAYSDIFVYI